MFSAASIAGHEDVFGGGPYPEAWIFRDQHHGTDYLDADAAVSGHGICVPQ